MALACVGAKVHDHLMHLGGICINNTCVFSQIFPDLNGCGECSFEQVKGLIDDISDLHGPLFFLVVATYGQDLFNQSCCPVA